MVTDKSLVGSGELGLEYRAGDVIVLREDGFGALAEAFFADLERKYVQVHPHRAAGGGDPGYRRKAGPGNPPGSPPYGRLAVEFGVRMNEARMNEARRDWAR